MGTQPARQTVDTGSLFQSVDRLCSTSQQQVVRTQLGSAAVVSEYVQVPSLWSQMEEAVASKNSGGGTGKAGPGSRPPIDVGMASLMVDIGTQVGRALVACGIAVHHRRVDGASAPPRPVTTLVQGRHPAPDPEPGREPSLGQPFIDPDLAAKLLERTRRRIAETVARAGARERDVAADLRALATYLAAGHTPQDVVTEWERTYRRWVAQAETALALESEENATVYLTVPGVSCDRCLATAVIRYDEDGETHWDPPLTAVIRDNQLLATTCRVCGGHR